MAKIKCAMLTAAVLVSAGFARCQDTDEKARVESVVRAAEEAFAAQDCEKADSYNASGARWIEGGPPESADMADWCRKAKTAGVRIGYRLHDFEVQIEGNVAWVTLIIDGSFSAATPEARALMGYGPADPSEWRKTSVESVVLRKTGAGWRIVLGHSSDVRAKRT